MPGLQCLSTESRRLYQSRGKDPSVVSVGWCTRTLKRDEFQIGCTPIEAARSLSAASLEVVRPGILLLLSRALSLVASLFIM